MRDIEAVRRSLATFFNMNPAASLEEVNLGEETQLAITKPWNDGSLVLVIPENDVRFVDALSNVTLPDRLSAIFHTDVNSLEVIWTAYRLRKSAKDVWERAFEFIYKGQAYKCQFRNSSERLLEIAATWRSVSPSETSYRNLSSFRMYQDLREHLPDAGSPFGEPVSFWIEDISLAEDDLISFLSHLNFYLGYFDDLTPLVLIHPPQFAKAPDASEIRYRHGKYPLAINAKDIDPEVLMFWSASHGGEPIEKFLQSYRIVEHAAFSYVDGETASTVRKVLSAPHALDDVHSAAEQVIQAVRSSSINDYQKMEHVMTECVSPDMLWQVVEANIHAFSAKQSFDGGFELKPLVATAGTKEDFANSGVKNVFRMAKDIRNALSHGKEARTASVIAPTKSNQEKLRPWANLMRRAAGEVVVYNQA